MIIYSADESLSVYSDLGLGTQFMYVQQPSSGVLHPRTLCTFNNLTCADWLIWKSPHKSVVVI